MELRGRGLVDETHHVVQPELSRAEMVSRLTLAIWLFGTLTMVRSRVRIRVDRNPM